MRFIMWVTMTKNLGDKVQNEKYDVDETLANDLVNGGFASKCEIDPIDVAVEKLQKNLADRDEKLIEKISASVKSTEYRLPAVAKNHADENLGEFVKCIGGLSCNNNDIAVKSSNMLKDKYDSTPVVVDDDGHKSHCIPDKFAAKMFGRTKTTTPLGQGTQYHGLELVPQLWQRELYQVPPYEPPVFPDKVRVYPMESNVLNVPSLDQTSTPSNGATAFAGGVSVGWVSEGSAPSDSTYPAFKNISLTAAKLLAFTQVSRELLDNSLLSVEQILTEQFRRAVLGIINYEVFNGTGGGNTKLYGLVEANATVEVARKTAGSVDWTDLAKMWARLAPQSKNNACWFINPLVSDKFSPINAPTHLSWTIDSVTGKPVMNFLGCPVVPTEFLPALGTEGDVLLADASYYVAGLNKNIAIESSPHVAFNSDSIVYRVSLRMAGKPGLTAPITLADGSSQVSPFVVLTDTAS